LIVGLIGLITIFINPYFIDGVTYPFLTLGNSFINSQIQEFKPLSISLDGGWSFVYIAIVITLMFIGRKKIHLEDILLILGTLFMSLTAFRYVSLFIICSSVILRNDLSKLFKFNELDNKALKATAIIVFGLITVSLFVKYIKNEYEYVAREIYPVKATEFLKDKIDSSSRIFNYYDWGSYLMLNNIKVYMDSRCDLYTKEYNGTDIANDYIKISNCDKEYNKIIEKYNLNTFIIPVNTPLETLLEGNKQYERIYTDDIAVIFMQK